MSSMTPKDICYHLWGLALLCSSLGGAPVVASLDDTKLNSWAKDKWYNPSLVEHGDNFISAIKATSIKSLPGGRAVWTNSLFMCEGRKQDGLQGLRCHKFDPWAGKYKECDLDQRVRGGKLDMKGLGDVKVWRWPGKGVYAIFGRKPQRNDTKVCNSFIIYHQWIAQIKSDVSDSGMSTVSEAPDASSAWQLSEPVPLLPSSLEHLYPDTAKYAMEKNWMPFVYQDRRGEEHLYVTYKVQPHIVFEILPGGESIHRYTTHDHGMMAQFAHFDVHGGPPLAYVSAEVSGTGQAYYLGIMHHIEKFANGYIRLYRHFAFKALPHPPFNITAVSDELPLVFNPAFKRTAFVAFVSGLDINSAGRVYITYGSADSDARVINMTVSELDALFTGQIAFRNINVPYEPSVSSHGNAKAVEADREELEEANE